MYSDDSEASKEADDGDDGKISADTLKRLRTAMAASYKKLEVFRKNRTEAIQQFVGSHYNEAKTPDKVPVNLLALAVIIFARQIVSKNPKVKVSTRHGELRPQANTLELAGDHLLTEIDFKDTLRTVAINALFGSGIVKIGMTYGKTVELDGIKHDIGQPFADAIDLDDFVFDMTAKRWDQLQFVGDKYRLPLNEVKEAGRYDEKVRKKLRASCGHDDEIAAPNSDGKSDEISRGAEHDGDYVEPYIDLWDIYLPHQNKIVTVAAEQPDLPPLREIDWEGPEDGPYRQLSFHEVPAQILGLPPVGLWRDLHELTNIVFNKVGRQAERQKTLACAKDEQDATRIQAADDGDCVNANPDNVKEARYGGPDQVSMAFAVQLRDMFAYNAGGLDLVGGLGPMSGTVGQDKLLEENSSKTLSEMQSRSSDFAAAIIQDLMWYLFYHPLIEIPLVKTVGDIEIETKFSSEEREGDFLQYNFDIVPYSMQEQTPQAQLEQFAMVFERFFVPLLPAMQQSGMGPNVEGILRHVAKLSNIAPFDQLVTFQNPAQFPEEAPVQGAIAKMPAHTTRTYERVNRSAMTRPGKDAVMAQAFMGGGMQPKAAAQVGRPV